jgi:hypothetical protein
VLWWRKETEKVIKAKKPMTSCLLYKPTSDKPEKLGFGGSILRIGKVIQNHGTQDR